MIWQLAHWLTLVVEGVAIASVAGGGCYFLSQSVAKSVRHDGSDWSEWLAIWLGLPLIGTFFIAGILIFPVYALAALIALGGAWAQSKTSPTGASFLSNYRPLAFASLGSVALNSYLIAFIPWPMITAVALLFGALVSPSVVPISYWMWQSLRKRPGLDRHLEEDEHP